MNKLIQSLVLISMFMVPANAGKVLVVVDKAYWDDPLANAQALVQSYANYVTQIDKNPVKIISDFVPTATTNIDQSAQLWNRLADEYQTDKTIEGAVLVGDLPIPRFFDPCTTSGYTWTMSNTSTKGFRRAQRLDINREMTIFSLSMYHNTPAAPGGKMILAVYDNSKNNTPGTRLAVTPITPISQTEGWQTIELTTQVYARAGDILWLAWIYSTNPGIQYENGTPSYAETSVLWVEGQDNMPFIFGPVTIPSTSYRFAIYANAMKSDNNWGFQRLVASDYIYMDVCNQNNNNQKYPQLLQLAPDDGGVWPTLLYYDDQGNLVRFLGRNTGTYNGDGKADIWISRIYAKNLEVLREPGASWGAFLEEHEIYDLYMQRVIDRMTLRSQVPDRAFAIGAPFSNMWTPEGDLTGLKDKFSEVPVYDSSVIRYILFPQNMPNIYQAQLQAGPFGGETWGASGGVKFPLECKINNTYPEYAGDSRGYEWALVYCHSSAVAHAFSGPVKSFRIRGKEDCEFGAFLNIQLTQPWHSVSAGGFTADPEGKCKADYFITYENDVCSDHLNGCLNPQVWYNFNNLTSGEYNAYCYIPSGITNTLNDVWVHVYLADGRFDNGQNHIQYGIKLENDGSGWAKVFPEGGPSSQWQNITLDAGKTSFEFEIHIHPVIVKKDGVNRVVVGDAVRLSKNSVAPNVWFQDNPPNMHKMVENDWKTIRGFTSMEDNGGQSKCKFYALEACNICDFSQPNCLGLMYAMDDNGLISYGRTTTNYGISHQEMFKNLKVGQNFGMAYLDLINSHDGFPRLNNTILTLFGAATLKAHSYKPYLDYVTDQTFTGTYDSKKVFWCGNNVTLQNVTVPYNANVPEFKVYAGGPEIRIKPETHIYYGCEAFFKLDPSLKP